MHYILEAPCIKRWPQMADEEKERLNEMDRYLIENAEAYYEHLSNVYDFANSDKPDFEWRWHLDRIVKRNKEE